MVGKIEKRYGAEVYISDVGKICIKQENRDDGEMILIFELGEVDQLIALLKEAQEGHAAHMRFVEEFDDESASS